MVRIEIAKNLHFFRSPHPASEVKSFKQPKSNPTQDCILQSLHQKALRVQRANVFASLMTSQFESNRLQFPCVHVLLRKRQCDVTARSFGGTAARLPLVHTLPLPGGKSDQVLECQRRTLHVYVYVIKACTEFVNKQSEIFRSVFTTTSYVCA